MWDSPETTVVEDEAFLKSFKSLEEKMDTTGLVLDVDTGILRQLL
jgi:hypothetical protein